MPYATEKIGAATLDDGLIQTLYGVSLELEGAAEDVTVASGAARARIEIAIDRLAEVMREVRRTIMDAGAPDPLFDPSVAMLDGSTVLRTFRAVGVQEREDHHG